MNRRDALKGLGLTLGYTVVTPTIVSMFQSCKTEADLWVPQFLSIDESLVIKNLIDLILPKTKSTLGALDVNVPQFLDLFIYKTYDEEEQLEFREGLMCIMNALNISDIGSSELKAENYDALLAKYLKASKEQQRIYNESENEEDEDVILFNALVNLRSFSVWAYKTSEQIGKNVLAYDPIPGTQKGCISVEEATDGKAWSL